MASSSSTIQAASSSCLQAAKALVELGGDVLMGEDIMMDQNDVAVDIPQDNDQETFYKEWKSYEYTVPWSNINTSILSKLDSAERDQKIADMKDVMNLKQWLMTALFNSYESFKEFFYVRTKTPGVKIYESVASQITTKYKCIKNMSDKNGYAMFLQSFSISMENKGRRAKEVGTLPLIRPSRRVLQTKGTPGVIANEYNPELTVDMQCTQTDYQSTLQTIYRTTRITNIDKQRITKLMHQSYELQRRDIVAAVQNLSDKQQDDPDSESEIGKLKSIWPFLFQQRWQSLHFLRLSGRNLEIPMHDYCQSQLRLLLQYLSNNSTDSGIRNVAALWKWEDSGKNTKVQLLVALQMLANYFNENIEILVKTAEKTTPDNDIVECVPNLTGELTIIALDINMYTAEKFYVSLDREVVLTADNGTDAISGLMQTAFIFDAHYPKELKFTFEFLERVICRLGGETTKRTTPVLTMSASVTRLVNAIDKFSTKLAKQYN